MPTTKELENLSLSELAALCGKVAESPGGRAKETNQARDLKFEWATIMASMTPPSKILKVQQEKERKIELWKHKAIRFLALVMPG
jgi:hypothetical protein